MPALQLIDLKTDPEEAINIADDHPEIVDSLTALVQKFILKGRGAPEITQVNNAPTTLNK
ncbi:MAG: hypothetical protein AAFZ15_21075 [Bacteroidota bacterium]